MLRRALTILSLIGLLLSVGLWGASYVGIGHQKAKHVIGLSGGRIDYGHIRNGGFEESKWHCKGFLGFRTSWWFHYSRAGNGDWWIASIPLWIPTAIFGIYPAYLLTPLHRRRKRKKLGLCLNCGYDLRGSKERCPECGEAVE